MLLALALLPLPESADRPVLIGLAVVLSALIVAAAWFAPWDRLPRYAEAVPPLAYFLVIALLRQSSDTGTASGYAALAMLPVFWLALYGTRGQLAIGIAGLASTFLAPIFLDAADYPASEWRGALLWICVAPIVGFTVQSLVERLRARAEAAARSEDETRRLLAYMASVTAVTRKMAGSSDSGAVREEICAAARAITGADFAFLIEPDTNGALTVARGVGGRGCADEDVVSAEEVYVSRRSHFSDSRSVHFEPVLRDDIAAGVLVVGWREPVAGLGEAAQSGLRMLAAEAAVAIDHAELLQRLEESARTDDLIGLPNRRAWEHELSRELARSERMASPICVAMLDLDCFKAFNDESGHQAGDGLLRRTAAAWKEQMRASDLLARYGGDEFALLLPGCMLDDAETLVQRLRVVMPDGQTVSVGVACWDGEESAENLIGRADAALYEAKRLGRDRLIAA
jgi:diguanylate cyclase (GGDEF)-like protein